VILYPALVEIREDLDLTSYFQWQCSPPPVQVLSGIIEPTVFSLPTNSETKYEPVWAYRRPVAAEVLASLLVGSSTLFLRHSKTRNECYCATRTCQSLLCWLQRTSGGIQTRTELRERCLPQPSNRQLWNGRKKIYGALSGSTPEWKHPLLENGKRERERLKKSRCLRLTGLRVAVQRVNSDLVVIQCLLLEQIDEAAKYVRLSKYC